MRWAELRDLHIALNNLHSATAREVYAVCTVLAGPSTIYSCATVIDVAECWNGDVALVRVLLFLALLPARPLGMDVYTSPATIVPPSDQRLEYAERLELP